MPDYTKLTVTELEAHLSALEAALEIAKEREAQEQLIARPAEKILEGAAVTVTLCDFDQDATQLAGGTGNGEA